MIKRRLFRHVQIQPPDLLRALCGLLQAVEGVLRFITLGIVTVWFSARVGLVILRRDVNRNRAKRGLPPYQPFQARKFFRFTPRQCGKTLELNKEEATLKRHPITEEVMP